MTLTLAGLRPPRPLAARARLAGAAAIRALGWPVRAWRARRLMEQMGALDDRCLRDIGLIRQDLRDCTALSPGQDPSLMLQHRVRQRRRR